MKRVTGSAETEDLFLRQVTINPSTNNTPTPSNTKAHTGRDAPLPPEPPPLAMEVTGTAVGEEVSTRSTVKSGEEETFPNTISVVSLMLCAPSSTHFSRNLLAKAGVTREADKYCWRLETKEEGVSKGVFSSTVAISKRIEIEEDFLAGPLVLGTLAERWGAERDDEETAAVTDRKATEESYPPFSKVAATENSKASCAAGSKSAEANPCSA